MENATRPIEASTPVTTRCHTIHTLGSRAFSNPPADAARESIMSTTTRRQFLGTMGAGFGSVAFGFACVERLGLAGALTAIRPERLTFGSLEPLVDLLQ